MATTTVAITLGLLVTGILSLPVDGDPLGRCLNTSHHLPRPVTHSQRLPKLCGPWSSLACCSAETASHAHHQVNHLNFIVQHCGPKAISEMCHLEFVRELCYYNCDPFIAPWIIRPDRTFPKERLMLVPLCQSQCNRWWNACADSYTCVRNWRKHFDFKFDASINSSVNQCPTGSECLPIKQIYAGPNDFCETVWDHSWKVVHDSQDCVRLSFPPDLPNPNRHVAQVYMNEENQRKSEQEKETSLKIVLIAIIVMFMVFYVLGKMLYFLLSKLYNCCCR